MVDAVPMRTDDKLAAILAEIEAVGPVLSGCIIERQTRCQTAGCHCRADPARLHGPYPTWTHREGGRQVTRTLSAEQAARVQGYIDADRRLRDLVAAFEAASIAVVEEREGLRLSPSAGSEAIGGGK